jgi:hypothetical protein
MDQHGPYGFVSSKSNTMRKCIYDRIQRIFRNASNKEMSPPLFLTRDGNSFDDPPPDYR